MNVEGNASVSFPLELDVGYLLERGFYQTTDIGLIRRSLQATEVHRAALQYVANMEGLTPRQWELVVRIRREIKKARRSLPKTKTPPIKRHKRKSKWQLIHNGG